MASQVLTPAAGALLPVLVIGLAGLDIAAGLVAKAWADQHSGGALVLGSGLYVLTFVVYAIALRYGRLSTVTVAWVVIVTVADMVIDRFWFDAQLSLGKWLAMIVAVGCLGYLLAGETS